MRFLKSLRTNDHNLTALDRWNRMRHFYVILGILLVVQEILTGVFVKKPKYAYIIVKPMLMFLVFLVLFILRSRTVRIESTGSIQKRKLLLITITDVYQVLSLSLILLLHQYDKIAGGDPINLFFEVLKFWILILFSLLSLFWLTSKICFFMIVFISQVTNLIVIYHADALKIGIQAIIAGISTIIILFLIDRNTSYLASNYKNARNQEKAWRKVLDFSREGVCIIDKNGETVYNNDCVNKILEFEPQLSELNYNVNLSKIKNIKFHNESRVHSVRSRTNIPLPLTLESHLYENQLLNINLDRTNHLKDLIDFLRSKWVNTVDLLRKLMNENGGCLYLDGEIEEQGVKTFIEARITIISYEDKNNLLVALYDVTAKNLLTSMKEIDKYRDKMTATISQQLLHPLYGSINYIRGANENFATPALIKDSFLHPALNSMNFLTNTISDLVDLFNLNSNSLRMKYHEYSLVETIKEVLEMIDSQADKKGIQIIKSFSVSPKVLCYTDHKRLMQILLNLLRTALKFTFKGSVTISLKKTTYKDFEIKIEDTGIGMREEEKRKLLDERGKIKLLPFVSAEYFYEFEVGLMISNELAKKLGPISLPDSCGIFCESEHDKGSSFTFVVEDKSYSQKIESGDHYKINIIDESKFRSYDLESDDSLVRAPSEFTISPKFFPEDELLRSKTSKSVRKLVSGWKAGSSKKINSARKSGQCNCSEVLIVDDDMFSVSSLEQILNVCHFTTNACFNGLEGIREVMMRKEKKCGKKCLFFKLMLVEMSMLVMGGEEFITTVRDLMNKNEIPHVPIIGCIKNLEGDDMRRARESGAVECIAKPISKEKVLEALQKVDIK